MLDIEGRSVTAAQVIARVKAGRTGVQVLRQPSDAPIDVLRHMIRHEASAKHLEVSVDHVDENLLLVIPGRYQLEGLDVRAEMNRPTGI